MILLACAVLIGLAAGRLREPLGARGYRPRFSHIWLLGVGAAANLVAFGLSGTGATALMALSLSALLGFVVANRRVTGVVVIGIGLFLNLFVTVINDGMPVRGSALTAAGVVDEADLATLELRGARHLEGPDDRLAVLGDVLPVGLPVGREVVSFGDLIVVMGCLDAVRELARRRRPRWSAAQIESYRTTGEVDPPVRSDPVNEISIRTGDVSTVEPAEPEVEPEPEARPPLARRRPLVAISQE